MLCTLCQSEVFYGKRINMNLLPSHSSYLYCLAALGRSAGVSSWMSSSIQCLECGILICEGSGVVCANFGHRRPRSGSCRGAWHARCYTQTARDAFPVLRASDLDDAMLTAEDLKEDDPNRFKLARESDHLMCPFQCDRCHFVNIQGRVPGGRHQDAVLLDTIRRANLDAFWSREASTIKSNLGEYQRVRRLSQRLGIDEPYPR